MIRKWIFMAFLGLGSCSEPSNIVGSYEIETKSYAYKLWKNLEEPTSFTVGSELLVRSDSSFTLKTCGNIISGKWRLAQDTLFLKPLTSRWRSDSLHKFGLNGKAPKVYEGEYKFKITNTGKLFEEVRHTRKTGKKVRRLAIFEKLPVATAL